MAAPKACIVGSARRPVTAGRFPLIGNYSPALSGLFCCSPTLKSAPALACRSCLIDGEVVICGEDGIPVFDRLRYGRPEDFVLFAVLIALGAVAVLMLLWLIPSLIQ
jgi:hypothetical protein